MLTLVVVSVAGGASFAVAGQSTAGEIQAELDSTDAELAEGQTKIVDINYTAPDAGNPDSVLFELEYDPDVISVEEVNSGDYLSNGQEVANDIDNINGSVTYEITQGPDSPADSAAGTVATVEIKLAEGVEEDDSTTIEFTSASVWPEDIGDPKQINSETITAADGIEKTDLSRFDKENNGQITFDDAINAIQSHHNEEEIGGEEVTFDHVNDVIEAYEEGTPIDDSQLFLKTHI